MLYSHYSQKNINLLVNPDVISMLDEIDKKNTCNNKIDIFDNETPYKLIYSNVRNNERISYIYKQNTMMSQNGDQKQFINRESNASFYQSKYDNFVNGDHRGYERSSTLSTYQKVSVLYIIITTEKER